MNALEVTTQLSYKAKQEFLRKFRDLVACVKGGANEIFTRIQADLSLDPDVDEALRNMEHELSVGDTVGDALTHSFKPVREVAGVFMQREFLKQICLSYLRLRARGAIMYACALTPAASEQLYQVEVTSGCRAPKPKAPQPVVKTLDEQVRADYSGPHAISADRMRQKMADPVYREAYDRLAETGALQ